MYQKIIKEVKKYAEADFANWLKPFLSIENNSKEVLLGVRTPTLRKLAKKYKEIDLTTLKQLLKCKIHDIRALAIFIMLLKSKNDPFLICGLYLQNLDYINNWDLIDYSAPHIVAPFVREEVLRELTNSDYLWANRVAMVSTIYYIKQNNYILALEFAENFITHPHHLMHKAAGWMLREIGKKDEKLLVEFLKKHAQKMPAIMRNYAMERLEKNLKKEILNSDAKN